jgi:branched-chain amino acid transport system permease protein
VTKPDATRTPTGGWIERPSREEIVLAVLVVGAMVAFPLLNPGYRLLSLAVTTGFTAIALYGLALQFGQAGILSVGHAGIVGVGAYVAAIMATQFGAGFWLALPISMLVAALAAAVVGLPALRVGGQHYIIITFCFSALLVIALTNGGTLTGSATGLDVGPIAPVFGINFALIKNTYALVAITLVICIGITYVIVNSAYGRTLRAIRENEPLARAIGINTKRQKLGAFFLSGAFAGLAGILQTYYLRHISPPLYGAFPSLYLALMIMLGGARYLYGPLVGAIIVTFLPEVGHLDPIDARIAYGVALLAVILLLPGGVSGGIAEMYRALAARRQHQPSPGPSISRPPTVG